MKRLKVLVPLLAVMALTGCATIEAFLPGSPANTISLSTVSVGNNDTVRLVAGTYTGRLTISANNATLQGAGIGKTVIRGDIVIRGNANRVEQVTVIGNVSIDGNTNVLTGADLSNATVSASGNNNRY